MDNVITNMIGIIGLVVGSLGLWYVFKFAMQIMASIRLKASALFDRDDRPRHLQAFPVLPLDDGAGVYQLQGVIRETEEEAEWMIDAKTRGNAIAKAEIRGMVVTDVRKFGTAAEARAEA